MKLFIGDGGGLNWGYTQTMFRLAYDTVGESWFDFGAGSERSFVCECKRQLPVAISEADHVAPKSKLSSMHKAGHGGITQSGTIYTFRDSGLFNGWQPKLGNELQNFGYKVQNTIFEAWTLKPLNNQLDKQLGSWPLATVLKNDFDNLQMMCAYCNRSKGNT